jgi:hypothetical protein
MAPYICIVTLKKAVPIKYKIPNASRFSRKSATEMTLTNRYKGYLLVEKVPSPKTRTASASKLESRNP